MPRSLGVQYATGEQWRNNFRKNEETEPKQEQHSVVDVTDDGSKVQCCKDLSVFQGEESDLSPSFRLSRSQTLKQQLLSFAGICSAVQLQLQSLMTARPGGLELCPG